VKARPFGLAIHRHSAQSGCWQRTSVVLLIMTQSVRSTTLSVLLLEDIFLLDLTALAFLFWASPDNEGETTAGRLVSCEWESSPP
jgi:hypothetical protein